MSAPTPNIAVLKADSPADLKACHKIRLDVFADEQGFPADTEFDEYDAPSASISWLATVDSTPAGTIRLVPAKGKLSRLAVLKEFRSHRLGSRLVRALEDWLVAHSAEVPAIVREIEGKKTVRVQIHSQIQVIPFYGRLGYREEGERFDEEGEPHVLMLRDIEIGA